MTPKQGHNGKSNAHRTHKGISRGMHKVLCVIKLMPCVCVFDGFSYAKLTSSRFTVHHRQQMMKHMHRE